MLMPISQPAPASFWALMQVPVPLTQPKLPLAKPQLIISDSLLNEMFTCFTSTFSVSLQSFHPGTSAVLPLPFSATDLKKQHAFSQVAPMISFPEKEWANILNCITKTVRREREYSPDTGGDIPKVGWHTCFPIIWWCLLYPDKVTVSAFITSFVYYSLQHLFFSFGSSEILFHRMTAGTTEDNLIRGVIF